MIRRANSSEMVTVNLHGVTAPGDALTFCGIQVARGRQRPRGKRVRLLQLVCSGLQCLAVVLVALGEFRQTRFL
jgi:hypothetical protein